MPQRLTTVWRNVQPLLLGVLLVVLLLLTLSVLILLTPVWMAAVLHWHYTERRFMRRLRSSGRLLSPAEMLLRMADGRGSLVLEAEREYASIVRVWWLPDRLVKLYPDMPWSTVEDLRRVPSDGLAVLVVSEQCRHWCDRYLPRLANTAHLIEITPEALWNWLDSSSGRPRTAAVVPYPNLSYRVKRAPA